MTGHQYSAPRLYIDSYLVCLRRRQPTAHGDCVPPWLPGCRTATEAAVGSERIHLRSGSSELHMALGLRKPLALVAARRPFRNRAVGHRVVIVIVVGSLSVRIRSMASGLRLRAVRYLVAGVAVALARNAIDAVRSDALFELFDVQDDFLQFHFLLHFSATPAYSDAHSFPGCPVASPPRPELDPNVSFEAARQDAPDRLTAAQDLRGAVHFRLEEL